MYSLQNSRIPLDQLTVRHLTRILSTPKRKFPTAREAWRTSLLINDHQWDEVAARCNTTFLTPKDLHTHFKHITHRALVTRERGCPPPAKMGRYAACADSEKKTQLTWANAM